MFIHINREEISIFPRTITGLVSWMNTNQMHGVTK